MLAGRRKGEQGKVKGRGREGVRESQGWRKGEKEKRRESLK